MSDKIKKGLIDDCPPEEKGGGKKGPIVRMEDHVKRLQEAAGLKGGQIDGIFGAKSSEAFAGKFGDINDPAVLEAIPADIRESIEAIQEKIGRGMFTQHIKDPGECVIDGSGGALLHKGGELDIPNMHQATPDMAVVERPLKRPSVQDGAALESVESSPDTPKYNADGSIYGFDPGFQTPKETAPSAIDPEIQETFKGIKNYNGGEQGKMIRLDQIEVGPVEIKRLDQIEVGPIKTIPLAAEMGRPQGESLRANNSAALDTSGLVQNVKHGVAGELKEMFFTADKNTGAPLDNPEARPVAMAANYTFKSDMGLPA